MLKNNLKLLLISANPCHAVGGIATWTNGYLHYCKQNNIYCDLVDTAKINNFRLGIFNELIRTYKVISNLKRMIASGKCYDVVHINSSIGTYGIIRDYLLARIIKKNKIPLVIHFHCDVEDWDQRKSVQYFMHKILRLADRCIVLCSTSKNHLRQMYNKQSVIIPNFIDAKDILERKKVNNSIKTIIYTGRVSEAKGCIEIFDLAKRFPDKLFMLVGKIFLNISDFVIPPNINMVGEKEHEEVLKLLDKADLFLFASHSEGFSIALTEAMARGLPSIVTDVGANRDMMSDNVGIVVPVGDIDRMESAIRTIDNQTVRQEMSDKALWKVRQEYTIHNVLEQIFLLYKGIVKNENNKNI